MAYQIVWTEKANVERQHILQFWIDHNKSKTFSLKLNKLFISAIRDIAKKPMLQGILHSTRRKDPFCSSLLPVKKWTYWGVNILLRIPPSNWKNSCII